MKFDKIVKALKEEARNTKIEDYDFSGKYIGDKYYKYFINPTKEEFNELTEGNERGLIIPGKDFYLFTNPYKLHYSLFSLIRRKGNLQKYDNFKDLTDTDIINDPNIKGREIEEARRLYKEEGYIPPEAKEKVIDFHLYFSKAKTSEVIPVQRYMKTNKIYLSEWYGTLPKDFRIVGLESTIKDLETKYPYLEFIKKPIPT